MAEFLVDHTSLVALTSPSGLAEPADAKPDREHKG